MLPTSKNLLTAEMYEMLTSLDLRVNFSFLVRTYNLGPKFKAYRFSCDTALDVGRELLLVSFLVLFQQVLHVIGNVDSEDVFTVGLGVELLRLIVVAWEAFGGVGDINTAINGTLHGSENSGTS